MIEPIVPIWDAPARVRAVVTTRAGGVSTGAHASLNLGLRCGDADEAVRENRRRLNEVLPAQPLWLRQVHGCKVFDATTVGPAMTEPEADACVTTRRGCVLAVLVADCMPVLLAERNGGAVGIAHAGWRGLSSGVLEATVRAFPCAPSQLVAWLGPAIGPQAYEVGDEVRAAFVAQDTGAAAAFAPTRPGHWLADLYALARLRLAVCGVPKVEGGSDCSYSDPARFFSYRRDRVTGRFGAFIWIE